MVIFFVKGKTFDNIFLTCRNLANGYTRFFDSLEKSLGLEAASILEEAFHCFTSPPILVQDWTKA